MDILPFLFDNFTSRLNVKYQNIIFTGAEIFDHCQFFFAKNSMKMKEFEPPGIGRVPGVPLRSANA